MKTKLIAFLKSLNWNMEDVKKILIFIVMLFIGCYILNNFLVINIEGDVDADVSGSIDADVSGSITANEPIGGFDVNIRQ